MRLFRASVIPEEFYPHDSRLPGSCYYQAPPPAAGTLDAEPLVGEMARVPDDRPMVLATLGSSAPARLGEHPRLVDVITEVLAEFPVTAIVAIGAGRDPERWPGARAENVHLTSFVQQRSLLPSCDLFITHGGFNGVRESLAAGVPMVVLPMFAEQPANARRVQELGAGLGLDLEHATKSALRTAVESVLHGHAFRAKARGIQRRTLALPPASRLLDDLACLGE